MGRICKALAVVYLGLGAIALALMIIGTFGAFGQERTPFAAVFLVPLGLPWVAMLDPLPETLRPWAAALSPFLNASILALLCRALSRSRG